MKRIFVFGSNLAGRHGAGSARYAAVHFNAEEGVGIGPTGNAYAIPTRDCTPGGGFKTLPLSRIKVYIDRFLRYARGHPELEFDVVAIGCGNAGYTPHQIAPLFGRVPKNVNLPAEFCS